MSRRGLIGLPRSMAREVDDKGICVNIIGPSRLAMPEMVSC